MFDAYVRFTAEMFAHQRLPNALERERERERVIESVMEQRENWKRVATAASFRQTIFAYSPNALVTKSNGIVVCGMYPPKVFKLKLDYVDVVRRYKCAR